MKNVLSACSTESPFASPGKRKVYVLSEILNLFWRRERGENSRNLKILELEVWYMSSIYHKILKKLFIYKLVMIVFKLKFLCKKFLRFCRTEFYRFFLLFLWYEKKRSSWNVFVSQFFSSLILLKLPGGRWNVKCFIYGLWRVS